MEVPWLHLYQKTLDLNGTAKAVAFANTSFSQCSKCIYIHKLTQEEMVQEGSVLSVTSSKSSLKSDWICMGKHQKKNSNSYTSSYSTSASYKMLPRNSITYHQVTSINGLSSRLQEVMTHYLFNSFLTIRMQTLMPPGIWKFCLVSRYWVTYVTRKVQYPQQCK